MRRRELFTVQLIEQALKIVLEDKPYAWQVLLARDSHQGQRIMENVRAHIARSHCYIAEITEQNPNVFLEIGKMMHYGDRPLILLRRKDAAEAVPADLRDFLYLEYEPTDNLDKLVKQIRETLKKLMPQLEKLRDGKKTYLSRSVLENKADISPKTVRKIVDRFLTVEDLCKADAEQISNELDVQIGSIQSAQESMKTYFGL